MTKCAHYLAAAVWEDKLTPKQCWEIKRFGEDLLRRELPPMKCGEIATALGYLTPADAESIESSRQILEKEQRLLDDPLSGKEPLTHRRGLRVPLRVLVYAIAFAVPASTFLFLPTSVSFRDRITYTSFAIALVISLGLNSIRDLFARQFRELSVVFSGIALFTMTAVSSLAAAYTAWCVIAIINSSNVVAAEYYRSLGLRSISSLAIVILGWIITAVIARVHRREIQWAHFRSDLRLAMHQRCGKLHVLENQDRDEQIRLVLELIGAALQSNIYDDLFRRIGGISRWNCLTATTVWYLEPTNVNKDQSEAGDTVCFRIAAVVASGRCTKEVNEAINVIKQKHVPKWNAKQFVDAVQSCYSRSSGFDHGKFRQLPNKESFMSLTGWIYEKRQTWSFEKIEDALWLVDAHARELEQFSKHTKNYLEVNSGSGFLVRNRDGSPRGVLLAFRHRQRGIPIENQEVLCSAAHLLSISLG